MATKNTNKRYEQQKRLEEKKKKEQRMQRLMLWTVGILGLAFIVFFFINAAPDSPDEQADAPVVDQTVFKLDEQPALGSKDAPVTIVEMADFKCPACQNFDKNIIPKLKADFIDTGKAQLHFVNYPIISPNADSRTAALAGEAVFKQNPDAFWDFYEAVYANQQDERKQWATADTLVGIAKDANLDLDFDKLKQDIEDETYEDNVDSDISIVRQVHANQTPTLFVNGKMLTGNAVFDYGILSQEIRDALGDTE